MAIFKATPRSRFPGFKDESIRAIPPEAPEIPQHAPLFYSFAERGPLTPVWGSLSDITAVVGAKTFDARSAYYSHQTHTARAVGSEGNQFMFKRVVDPAAKTASLVFKLGIKTDDIPVYKRNVDDTDAIVDGKVTRTNGERVIEDDGGSDVTVSGIVLKWFVEEVDWSNPDIDTLEDAVAAGQIEDDGDYTVHPLFALETHIGKYGNNMGIRLSSNMPVVSGDPSDQGTMIDQGAVLYRAQLVERLEDGTDRIVTSLNGENSLEVALKEGAFDPRTGLLFDLEDIVNGFNRVGDPTGLADRYGPFVNMAVNYATIDSVQQQLYAVETVESAVTASDASTQVINPDPPAEPHLINIMNNADIKGREYYFIAFDYEIDGGATTGRRLTKNTTHLAKGGTDGSTKKASESPGDVTLATLVKSECDTNWENPDYPLTDITRYPISHIYDTGFPLETKYAMISTMSYRPNLVVEASTHVVHGAQLSNVDEIAVAATLGSKIGLNPESALYGTQACRADIWGHMFKEPGSDYKGWITSAHDYAVRRARFAGAGNGNLKPEQAPDIYPANRLEGYTNVNNTWKPEQVKDNAWDANMNYVQAAGIRTFFYPAFQTAYENETSILNSVIIRDIMADLVLVCDRIWVEFTGRSDLTPEQWVEKTEERFNELVDGRYADRVVLIPQAYFTPADEARGYSWRMEVGVYGNNMRTVGTFPIIARRQEDLPQSA